MRIYRRKVKMNAHMNISTSPVPVTVIFVSVRELLGTLDFGRMI